MVMPVEGVTVVHTPITHCGKCKIDSKRPELMKVSWTPTKGSLYCNACKVLYLYQKEGV